MMIKGDGIAYFYSLREANLKRVEYFKHTLEGWTPAQWACALAGEVGELCNLIKKDFRRKDDKDAVTTQMLADEMADVAIYLDLIAARHGIDLRKAIVDKWNEKSAEVNAPFRLKNLASF